MNSDLEAELSQLQLLSPDCAKDWRSGATAHHNVLLEGPQHAMEMALVRLLPHLREPVRWRRPGEALELVTGPCTLILQDVATLNAEEQTGLCELLNDSPQAMQVVSTASSRLFSFVEAGLFDDELYYRLNVMLLVVNASSANQSRVPYGVN